MKKCPVCGGKLQRQTKDTIYKYKGKKIKIKQPGDYCTGCSECYLTPEDLKATRHELQDFRRKIDHFLTGKDIRKIRKRVNLTQARAAKLFGGGKNAFSKYEREEIRQPQSTDILLRLLDEGKISVNEIENLNEEVGYSLK